MLGSQPPPLTSPYGGHPGTWFYKKMYSLPPPGKACIPRHRTCLSLNKWVCPQGQGQCAALRRLLISERRWVRGPWSVQARPSPLVTGGQARVCRALGVETLCLWRRVTPECPARGRQCLLLDSLGERCLKAPLCGSAPTGAVRRGFQVTPRSSAPCPPLPEAGGSDGDTCCQTQLLPLLSTQVTEHLLCAGRLSPEMSPGPREPIDSLLVKAQLTSLPGWERARPLQTPRPGRRGSTRSASRSCVTGESPALTFPGQVSVTAQERRPPKGRRPRLEAPMGTRHLKFPAKCRISTQKLALQFSAGCWEMQCKHLRSPLRHSVPRWEVGCGLTEHVDTRVPPEGGTVAARPSGGVGGLLAPSHPHV
nr:uncharacterized protein LOC115866235 [Globicephala melas]XP_030737423.1 uncharacterized protein LOC115866235 [Globicephala melas]XP_030737424.1 uncharacterized protein LOC115866235 [Globicephala melas]XP_030737425.1 uncharacterized protein LOC115866235 [Globicephala melas]XP_030737426.1 uncharacterized protein LOC115866235 [Globicephala melas]